MTQREIEDIRARLDGARDALLSAVKAITGAMAALPAEPAPPKRDPHDDSDISFAGS